MPDVGPVATVIKESARSLSVSKDVPAPEAVEDAVPEEVAGAAEEAEEPPQATRLKDSAAAMSNASAFFISTCSFLSTKIILLRQIDIPQKFSVGIRKIKYVNLPKTKHLKCVSLVIIINKFLTMSTKTACMVN